MGSMSTKAKARLRSLLLPQCSWWELSSDTVKVEGIFNPKKAEPEITTTIVSVSCRRCRI